MSAGKAVSTTATDCTFGTYFGAGYGGNSYSRRKYYDGTSPAWATTLQGYYTAERGKYYNGTGTNLPTASYGKKGPGVATDFDYEFFVWSSGQTGGRFFVKFVSFSLAQCNDVSSTLKRCKVTGSFYGGGSLGKVMGNVTSDLEDCEVTGNVFGAGFSASLPKIAVRNGGFTKIPNYNKNSGMFEPASISGTTDYEWTQGTYPSEGGAGFSGTSQIITEQVLSMTNLGSVEGNVTLNITGSKTTVGGSIYGGGEESVVNGSTTVNVSSGTIGTTGKGGAEFGNVYGGGMGKDDNVMAGLVKGNTNVNISGTTTILHNVYGGGAYGSVGNFDYNGDDEITSGDKNKDATTGDVVSGVCNVTITGGTIGTTGKENGMVFGSSRGDVARPGADGKDPNDRLAWVYDTNVTIGRASSATDVTSPLVRGSVYGSGENGHTYHDAAVNIYSGTIGIGSKEDGDGGARCPARGNVYGGGCGTDTYTVWTGEAMSGRWLTYYNPKAGIVLGNTTVTVTGGHVVHNVYGGGAMGSVGTFTEFDADATNDVPDGKPTACREGTGCCTVSITGGKIGLEDATMRAAGGPDDFGHVFGAGRGVMHDPDDYPNLETSAFFNSTRLTIGGTALVCGSVYGGSESGHVLGDAETLISGTPVIGSVGTAEGTYDKMQADTDEKTHGHITVDLTGGTIWQDVYGGCMGTAEKDKAGNMQDDLGVSKVVTVNLNQGLKDDESGCVVKGNIFGCNNVYGSPQQAVEVHIYGTQNAEATQIANTEAVAANGDQPAKEEVRDAKKTGRYDVKVAYGGAEAADIQGNVTLNITNGTFDRVFGGNNISGTIHGTITVNVEETGCKPVIIGQLYGGGNQAAYTAPSGEAGPTVNVNSFTSIGEVYGGGYGKTAQVTGDTYVNIDVIEGSYSKDQFAETSKTFKFTEYKRTDDGGFELDDKNNRVSEEKTVTIDLPGHEAGTIGAIKNVFGGGNEAKVVGSTNVNIGTKFGVNSVVGADIRGNVYGGGNNAEVTGDTNVTIGKKAD